MSHRDVDRDADIEDLLCGVPGNHDGGLPALEHDPRRQGWGSCGTGYSGECAYSCNNGTWTAESACVPDGCPEASKSWSVGGNDCSATLAMGEHGKQGTATDDDYPGSGSATYACSTGTWTEPPTSKTCHAGCAGETIAGCKLPNTVHGTNPEGVCQGLYTDSCSYSCGTDAWKPMAKTECTPPRTVTVQPGTEGCHRDRGRRRYQLPRHLFDRSSEQQQLQAHGNTRCKLRVHVLDGQQSRGLHKLPDVYLEEDHQRRDG